MKRLAAIALLLPVWLFALPVPPIQHSPWTTTTNDPTVTLQATQPVSITTTNQIALIANGLISSSNTVNGALNVKAVPFQAVGNNIADDYAAIQGAINTAGNGGSIYLPQGIYYCSQPLVMKRNQRLVGEGAAALSATTTSIRFAGSGIQLIESVDEFDYPCIENICLVGAGTGIGIDCQHVHQVYLKRCRAANFNYGIRFLETWDNVMEDVQCSGNTTAGLFIDTHATDIAALECQFSNNSGYGVLLDTAAPRDIQLIRFFGGSMQYNRYGNWLNGGISLLFDNVHFEGNGARDLLLGSATNRVYALDMRVNHYDWSDNQYTNAVTTWGDIPGYYQIVCSNVFHLVNNDEHSNVAGTHKRVGVYVSELCEDVSLNGISSYVAPYAISKIRLNPTNPGRNLIPNGLLSRDIANENNYPFKWISDDTNAPVALSQSVSNILGYTYTFQLTNNLHIYPDVTNYPLQLGNTYTWTTVLRATNGQRVMLEGRNRFAGSGTDTANVITNDNTYQWIVSRYVVDDTNKLDAVFYYRQLEPGFASIEFGEVSLVAGNGVGGASTWDSYHGPSEPSQWPIFSTSGSMQGSHLKGEIAWNHSPELTNALGWVCVASGSPGTWVPFGGLGFTNGTANYIPKWTSSVPTLTSTSLLYDNGTYVGLRTNAPSFSLHLYNNGAFDGLAIDGDNPTVTLRDLSGTPEAYVGVSTTSSAFFSDSNTDALNLRSQANEINLGGAGGTPTVFRVTNTGSKTVGTVSVAGTVNAGTVNSTNVFQSNGTPGVNSVIWTNVISGVITQQFICTGGIITSVTTLP